jgi:hypothetical protein
MASDVAPWTLLRHGFGAMVPTLPGPSRLVEVDVASDEGSPVSD